MIQEPLLHTQPANCGGKQVKKTELYNHHKALINSKPMTNTCLNKKDQPHPHVDAKYRKNPKPPLRYKYLEEYGNVYKTYKACDRDTVKTKVDDQKPKSQSCKHLNVQNLKNPKVRKSKGDIYIDQEHARNVNAYMNKVIRIGNWQDRLKNQSDPLAHPTILFKHEQNKKDANKKWVPGEQIDLGILKPYLAVSQKDIDKAKLIGLKKQPLAKEGGGQMDSKWQDRINELGERPQVPVIDQSKRRPFTAKELKQQFHEEEQEDFVNLIPKAQGTEEEDYQMIKVSLIKLIIDYRIFTDMDLETLFARTVVHNQHMERMVLEDIFKELKDELEN